MSFIKCLRVGTLQTNCYIYKENENSTDAIIIDPGDDYLKIKTTLTEINAKAKLVLLTHGHFDHILALDDCRTSYTKTAIHENDSVLLTQRDSFSQYLKYDPRPLPPPDYTFSKDGSYNFEGFKFDVIHTPGHTPGSCCFIFGNILFSGDTLFYRGIGRTDFDGGNMFDMTQSLKKICSLPGDYIIYPGHGERTFLSDEKKQNSYLKYLI